MNSLADVIDVIELRAGKGNAVKGRRVLLSVLLLIALFVFGFTFFILVPSIDLLIASL